MPETLYLIDGYAQIFRAYYAIRGGMRSPVTEEPTHAVFGFAAMLLKLLSQYDPAYVAVAIDTPGKVFRDDLYAEYKGTRDEIPADLLAQIPRVLELIERFGIPAIGVPGLEADDVIGCITRQVLEDPRCAGVEIRIISRDKDLEQLLCERVALFDIHTDTLLDVAALLETKGITPAQVVDVLALTGDSVDNVPGVEGVGIKTAALLVREWGSLDGVLANLEQIKGKRRENLERARAHLPLSRTLVTLKCDVDVPFSLEAARSRLPDPDRLTPLFKQLGFNRFQEEVRRLAGGPALDGEGLSNGHLASPAVLPALDAVPAVLRVVNRADDLQAVAGEVRGQSLLGIYVEPSDDGRDGTVRGLALAWGEGGGAYIPAGGFGLAREAVLAVLGPVLGDPEVPKCGHNLKLAARLLLRDGIRLRGVQCDTLLAAMLLDPSLPAHKLDQLASTVLGHQPAPPLEAAEEGAGLSPEHARFCVQSAELPLRLTRSLGPRLEQAGLTLLLREVEAPLAPVMAEMEVNGILCDPEEIRRQGGELAERAAELRGQIQEIAGCEFHVDSTKQLAEVLFDRLGLKTVKKNKTGRSTDFEVLEKLAADEDPADPRTSVPRLVIEYRHLQKLISNYLGTLCDAVNPRTGRIHTTFHQIYTATGRIMSHGPNLQTIPVRTEVGRQIRKAFHAPPGHVLICADYSQIELRILAHLSRDPALVDAFERDQDIHTAVAAQVFGAAPEDVTREQRSNAKTINFGIIYGITPYGLARRIDGLDVAGAARLIADYRERFPGIERFLFRCIQQALEDGCVTTLMGRRRAIPEITSANRHTRALGERLAINSVVQGSGADLIKRAMVNVQGRIDRDGRPLKLLLQIHDELVFECPAEGAEENARAVCEEMERAAVLSIPLKAEAGIGTDWMSAK